MAKRKSKAITPEVMPKQDEHAERVVNFHLAGKAHASAAVFCAAAAGAVMLQKKKELGHGRGFTKWKEALAEASDMSAATADRYMALAIQMVERIKALPQDARAGFLADKANSSRVRNLPEAGESDLSYLQALASFDPAKTHELRQQAMS